MNEERIAEIQEEIEQIKAENTALSSAMQEAVENHAEVSEGPNVKYKRQSLGELSTALMANRRRLAILRQELNSMTGVSVVSSSPVAFFTR